MAKPTGFMEFDRKNEGHRPVSERVRDFFEISIPLPEDQMLTQAARCMDCGIPFCHGTGCPLGNLIPEFNDLVYHGRWQQACDVLHSTNNFPEITGRVCPAPCEASCTLSIDDDPVLIRHIELQIVEKGFENGWVKPQFPLVKTGKRVAIIGSGPAGLAAAQQIARMGHEVTVFEKDDRIGGLLRYGIPDFKLDKKILDRRLNQLREEGVQFQTHVVVGEDISVRYLRNMFDAILVTVGAGQPRDLSVPGRDLENVHYAMDFLRQQNKINAGDAISTESIITAQNKIVLVIGGGDTGSDCVGTARRQNAREIHQWEILPQPPESRPADTPWPQWPRILRTSTSHEEGCTRRWAVLTKKFSGQGSRVIEAHAIEVEWTESDQGWKMNERAGTEFVQPVDLVLLAMGFTHVTHDKLVEQLKVNLDPRGNIQTAAYLTSQPGVFAAGDASAGASLVVRAINAGRQAADAIDKWLTEN